MDRQGAGRPDFRLRFDYPYLEIERVGAPAQRVPLEAGDAGPALRGFAAEVARTRGRLTATLPEAEVWRGRVAAADAGAAARRAASAALGAAPTELQVMLGPVGVDGLRPAAAVRRDTLREARAFLARSGLGPARLTGAGAFPGFDGPPAFPRFAPPAVFERRGARAAGACGLAAALALIAWLAPWRDAAPAPQQAAAAPVLAAPSVRAAAAPVAPLALTGVAAAQPQPRARPEAVPPLRTARAVVRPDLVPVGLAARNAPADIAPPAALPRPARAGSAALARVGSPLPRPVASRAAAPVAGRAADGSDGPLPRPAVQRAAPAPAAALDAVLRAAGAPRPRPAAPQGEVRVASLGPALVVSDAAPAVRAAEGEGPRARPAAAPVRVASLDPAAIAGIAAGLRAAAAPPPRPAAIEPAKPKAVAASAKPKPAVVRAQPAPVKPTPVLTAAPAPVRTKAAAAKPKPVLTAVPASVRAPAKTQTVRVKAPAAAPVRTAALSAEPMRAAPKAKAKPARTQRAPAQPAKTRAQRQPTRDEPSLRGSSLALVGIFGGADGRHALVQLPNGSTERVRAGDKLQGVQITSIAADGVHLRARGRDTVLRLPD